MVFRFIRVNRSVQSTTDARAGVARVRPMIIDLIADLQTQKRRAAVSRGETGSAPAMQIASDNLKSIRQDSKAGGLQGGGVIMQRRHLLVSSAMALFALALFASAAFGAAPAAATPCTNLSGLQLQHTTITSAADNDTGVFVTPSTPPTTLTGLPAFCRVT